MEFLCLFQSCFNLMVCFSSILMCPEVLTNLVLVEIDHYFILLTLELGFIWYASHMLLLVNTLAFMFHLYEHN
jgi:hypothetical protein